MTWLSLQHSYTNVGKGRAWAYCPGVAGGMLVLTWGHFVLAVGANRQLAQSSWSTVNQYTDKLVLQPMQPYAQVHVGADR